VVIDSSALVAIVQGEPGATDLERRLRTASVLFMGAPTLVEALMVLESRGLSERAEVFVQKLGIQVLRFESVHARAALAAFRLFGKGRHPASLNYGDCMAYAVAKVAELPLLFVGNDFSRTDDAAA
jgi:ribonuclease VapC